MSKEDNSSLSHVEMRFRKTLHASMVL